MIDSGTFRPLVLDPRRESDLTKLDELKKSSTTTIVDDYKNQIDELDQITELDDGKDLQGSLPQDAWVYYSWSGHLVHTVTNPHFDFVRDSRNKNLILADEQQSFSGKTIGVAGLNVGNPAAICMVLEGVLSGAKYADNDILSLSNLNRFRARVADLGLNKAVLSARQSFEINPFLSLEVFETGIALGQERDFLTAPKLDVLIEEMDNLVLKVSIRQEAKLLGIPVVMVTGNGENVIVDVERYDLDPDLKILNGYLDQSIIETIQGPKLKSLSGRQKVLLARDFMGERYLVERLRLSFMEVGQSLAGIPQLAESSFLRGAAVCFVVRRILSNLDMPSGRYYLELDQLTSTRGRYDTTQ